MDRASLAGFRLTATLMPLLAAGSAAGQEDGAFDRTPRDCIVVQSIDDTDAIDDQNIIFRMRGDKVYRNHLPRKCPGLERENRFAYETRSSRLCSIDTITVLEDFGVGFRPGFTCRLGEFVPLSPAEIEELEFREDGEAGQSGIETSSVEGEGAESDEGEVEAAGEGSPADATPAEPPAAEN
ncbi:MAG: hypothetical protein EHM50_01695 [Lysobacterales bacterium]|nr:MAG: hypothetical protein EHM50_01695 [Xanthomonadales bacterium]